MTLPIGRQGRIYGKKESSYGVDPTLAATNAIRHIDLGFAWNPFNRVTSAEKKVSPGAATRFDRLQAASWELRDALLRPSGALNTLPEVDPVLEAAFGSLTNVTLSATVQAAPSPTVNTFTLDSVAGLAVGDAVLVTVTGQSGPYVRVISAINTAEIVVEPDLPAAPTSGDAVKGCVTYKLTTALAVSLHLAHFNATGQNRCMRGAGVDRLRLAFDQNEEPHLSAAGPAKDQITTGHADMPSDPSTFTTVGGNPPSGLVGDLWIGNGTYLHKSLQVEITNGLAVRDSEYGVNAASELYRRGRREVSLSLEAWAETAATLYDLAEAGTTPQLLHQTGRTEGNIVALFAQAFDVMVPTQDDPDEEVGWSFSGIAKESADGQNDELKLILA